MSFLNELENPIENPIVYLLRMIIYIYMYCTLLYIIMGYSYLMDVHGILFSQQFGAPTYGNSAGLQSP